MNVNEAVRQARALLDEHGLRGWTVVLDNAKNRAGRCNYRDRTISLSRVLIELRSEEQTSMTIKHEVAHALCPRQGHNAIWSRKFRELGGHGQRCRQDSVTVAFRYTGTCPGCGKVSGRHKLSKAITKGASCGRCAPGRFDARYQLVWVDARGVRV